MKKHLNKIAWLIAFYMTWLVLFSNFNYFTLISGLIASPVCLWFTEKFLIDFSYTKHYTFNLLFLTHYFLKLILEIYSASFDTIKLIITGQINPKIVTITTPLQGDFKRAALANSITLTPGTVTVDLEKNTYKVLWLDAKALDSKTAGILIKDKLEKNLLKGEG